MGRWVPGDVLAEPPPGRGGRPAERRVEAVAGLRVAHRGSGFTGAVVATTADDVTLRGPAGTERVFRLLPRAFAIGTEAVTLVRPKPAPTVSAPSRTASGSVAVAGAAARVARGSRIWVEGVHDAELVERVWGDDLRVEGVVVERLDGIDHLAEVVRGFRPGPGRRLGVLVDHLVPGSKESRLAAEVVGPDVAVAGSPYVDIWQAIRPGAAGIPSWPEIPRGTPWKEGVCAALGLGDPPAAWRRLLASVSSYADLEPVLVGAVESLIDFVTEPG